MKGASSTRDGDTSSIPSWVPVLLFMASASAWSGALWLYFGAAYSDLSGTKFPLPDQPLEVLGSSESVELGSLQGEPYLINFWASWCVTCQTENKFLHEIASENIRLVGIALKDDPISAEGWLQQFGSPFQLSLVDSSGSYGERLGVQGAPETFLVDRDGNVRFHYQGLIQPEVWQSRIRPLYLQLRGDSP